MNGFVTTTRFATNYAVPIALPQMELRRGRFTVVGQVQIVLGQTMRVRMLNLHLINVITINTAPVELSTPMGVVSAGIYLGPMITSSPAMLRATSPGVVSMYPFQYREFSTPGIYYFVVSNNTTNIDVTVALTGLASILNG